MTTEAEQNTLDLIAEVIRENYALGRVDTLMNLPSAHQRRHRKLVVNTAMGKFLAKTYRDDPYVLDALRFQHRLSDHLLSNGIPVAKIQPATNGKRIVESDNWALELQQFIEGEPMKVCKETLMISAQALGKFHECCREFPRPPRDAQMWRFSEVPRETFGKLYEVSLRTGAPSLMNDCCNTIALFLRDAGEMLRSEQRDRFETGLIHGDWHSGNLLFEGDRMGAVVDLEFAGDGCYLEDLSYAISNLCIRTTVREGRLAKRTDILLEQYQKYRTLSFYEEAALYYAVGVKHVATVAYQTIQQNNTVAGLTPDVWMERLAAQCAWLAERARRVRFG